MNAAVFFKLSALVVTGWLVATPVSATVFYSKDEALELAFGNDAAVELQTLFPAQEQIEAIERLAKTKLDSKMLSMYLGKKQGRIVGYAAIDSHPVRSQNETLLIVLDAAGELRNVHTLAFHEPPEYQAPRRWFETLFNLPIEKLGFDADVQAVAGATLSTRSALASARKVLSVFHVMMKPTLNP